MLAPLASPSFTGTVTAASDITCGGQIRVAGNINGTNASQTTIVCNQLLKLQQNGDALCDTNLYLAGRSGTIGLQLENTSTNASYGLLDFVYSVNNNMRSWRLETRTAYAKTGVPSLTVLYQWPRCRARSVDGRYIYWHQQTGDRLVH